MKKLTCLVCYTVDYLYHVIFFPGGSYIWYSGVARISCAMGREVFLRPSLTKSTEFEVKNRCKRAEEAKRI